MGIMNERNRIRERKMLFEREVKRCGGRITTGRTRLIEILSEADRPIGFGDLLEQMQGTVSTDRTTLYRNLLFLESIGIVRRLMFYDGGLRWEWCDPDNHHHHAVCVSCRSIEEIRFPESMERTIESVGRKKKFRITSHSLELFGLCKVCMCKNSK